MSLQPLTNPSLTPAAPRGNPRRSRYHYLLQAPLADHGVDLLQTSVFNTEAHPLSVFGSPRFNELVKLAPVSRGAA